MYCFYRGLFIFSSLFVGLVFFVDTAAAQVPNYVSLRASGVGSSIVISVELDVGGMLPQEWVGWVIDRTTIGICEEPEIQIGDSTPFPVGEQSFVRTDNSVEYGVTYKYRIYAIDAEGVRYYLPGFTEWPPGYYHFDYASIDDSGYVAEGTLVDMGWTTGIVICEGSCWEYVSFISGLPAELAPLVGTPATIRLTGVIDAEFEGPYVSSITSWSVVSGCSPVSTVEMNWGGLKALYR
jgi:hypothetical protein